MDRSIPDRRRSAVLPSPRPAGVSAPRRRPPIWASVFQAKFLEGLRLEKVELELGQRFQRQRLNLLLDLGRQRAELGFHLPQGRPPLALLNATFVGGLHEEFNLLSWAVLPPPRPA